MSMPIIICKNRAIETSKILLKSITKISVTWNLNSIYKIFNYTIVDLHKIANTHFPKPSRFPLPRSKRACARPTFLRLGLGNSGFSQKLRAEVPVEMIAHCYHFCYIYTLVWERKANLLFWNYFYWTSFMSYFERVMGWKR